MGKTWVASLVSTGYRRGKTWGVNLVCWYRAIISLLDWTKSLDLYRFKFGLVNVAWYILVWMKFEMLIVIIGHYSCPAYQTERKPCLLLVQVRSNGCCPVRTSLGKI